MLVAETGSTNDDAAELARHGAPEGTCVVAEEQTGGRGRLDRTWHSPVGAGLWASVVIRAGDVPRERWAMLSIAAGLAAVDALGEACAVRAELKWPNDIVVVAAACGGDGGLRKLGGILSEVIDADAVVIGLGVNVSLLSAELPHPAASSVLLQGGRADRPALLVALLTALADRVEQWRSGDPALLDDYRGLCATIGRYVTVDLPSGTLTGIVSGVDDAGHLLVSDGESVSTVTSGDVIHATI